METMLQTQAQARAQESSTSDNPCSSAGRLVGDLIWSGLEVVLMPFSGAYHKYGAPGLVCVLLFVIGFAVACVYYIGF